MPRRCGIRQLYLKFDGANSLADVYLNGELLTTHTEVTLPLP